MREVPSCKAASAAFRMRVPRSRADVALQLRADDASIRDDAFISVDALEEIEEDPLLDANAFRAHVRANRERLSRTWSVV